MDLPMSQEEEWEAEATEMAFGCPDCKVYWKEMIKYWRGLGKEIPELLLNCPACNYRIGRKLVW